MIILSAFQCEQSRNSRNYTCDVAHELLPKHLFFNCLGNNLPPVDLPSCNWAAVALLFPAMVIGEDLVIEGPVSPELLFALNGDAQSLLLAAQKNLSRIRVSAEPFESAQIIAGTEVATGFSAGIDSFATLDIYARGNAPDGMSVTTLTMFNAGAMGGKKMAKKIFHKYCDRLTNYAEKYGYNWQSADSNLDEFYIGRIPRFVNTHVVRNIACAYLFEDLYKTYLHSSSYGYNGIQTSNYGMSSIEPMLLPLLEAGILQFVSAGAGLSRIEKTRLVSKMEIANDLLDVCVVVSADRVTGKYINCGTCWKCARTLITLDVLGTLEQFANVIDLEKFRSERANLVRKICWHMLTGNTIDRELVRFMHTTKYKAMPVWLSALCLLGFAGR